MDNFNKRLLKQILIGVAQAILILTQGATLNYYIISHNSTKFEAYFNFLGDIICVFLFAGYQAVSYRYLITLDKKNKDAVDYSVSIGCFNPRKNMSSCLSAASWTFYSVLLIIKISVIFSSDMMGKLSTKEVAGPQLLKVAIALSTLIFLLQVEGYNWSRRGTPRYEYINSECFRTAIEILDSVSLLSLLIPGNGEVLDSFLSTMAVLFASCNFVFPLFILHHLYSKELSSQQKLLPFIHKCFHLVFSDIAFLTIRIYFWVQFNDNASIFLMKNILGILHSLNELFPTAVELCQRRRHLPSEKLTTDHDVHSIEEADELKKITELCT